MFGGLARVLGCCGDHFRFDLVKLGKSIAHPRTVLEHDSAPDQIELPGDCGLGLVDIIGAQAESLADGILGDAVVAILVDVSAGRFERIGLEAEFLEKAGDRSGVAVDVCLGALQVGGLGAVGDGPGGEVGGDVTLGKAAYGDAAIRHLGAQQAVTQQIAACNKTNGQQACAGEPDLVSALDKFLAHHSFPQFKSRLGCCK